MSDPVIEAQRKGGKRAQRFKEQVCAYSPEHWAKRIETEFSKGWQKSWAASMLFGAYSVSKDVSALTAIMDAYVCSIDGKSHMDGVRLLARIGIEADAPTSIKKRSERFGKEY